MQTRTKKTLATTALGLAFAAAAAGTASAAAPADVIGGSATRLVPGALDSTGGAQNALANGTSALSGNPAKLLPSGNHLDGNQIAPVSGLLGGIPVR
ncbi:ATP-binding protein [Streptomyces sp. NPDC049040]|uniref:ATP-binding protein n=1 Tax=Streptomyces sp. NPDC049040 TaxID=3365593 RepID=UPI003720F43E